MRKLNTHHYDGQLHTLYQEIEKMVKNPIPLETTYQEIILLINTLLSKRDRKDALNIINILRTSTGKPQNNDSKNNINVDKLLPLVWTCVKEYDDSAKRVFLEQIIEMKNGLCPQGRTTRLIQIVETTIPPKPTSIIPILPQESTVSTDPTESTKSTESTESTESPQESSNPTPIESND